MITPANANQPVVLGQSGQIQAPHDNVQLFQTLMSGMGQALNKGQSSFTQKTEEKQKINAEDQQGTLVEETAVSLDKAQIGLKQLETEMNKSTHDLNNDLTLNSDFTRSLVYQKYTSAAYFVSITRVSNRGSDISEEMSSIIKGR